MIKYFKYERSKDWVNCPHTYKIEEIVNDYAKENNLQIISATCDRDVGIFVIFANKERQD